MEGGQVMSGGRIPSGGRLIDRSKRIRFRFNGRFLGGYQGDTLASALLANGHDLVARSFKYHRRRGILASGPEEPNALMTVGSGAVRTPNERATMVPLVRGLKAKSQNHWPTLSFDLSALNNKLSKFFPAGFYYKTFMAPRFAWKWLYEPVIRRQAGLGKPPKKADPEAYEHYHHHTDVLIAGGGVAGLQAALAAAESGASVLLLEQNRTWGGRAPVDGAVIDGKPAQEWIDEAVTRLKAMKNVILRAGTVVTGVYDHGHVLALEHLEADAPKGAPRQRLWMIRTHRVVVATGAIERPLMFAGNDLPGVMLASAVRDYVVNYGVRCGQRTVIVTNTDDAYRTALTLVDAGQEVAAVIDTRGEPAGALPDRARAKGIRILPGAAIASVKGKKRVEGVEVTAYDSDGSVIAEVIPCDCIAMSGGWSPVVHLWSQVGGKLTWDERQHLFRPFSPTAPTGADGEAFVLACGAANGHLTTGEALTDGHTAGMSAASVFGVLGRGKDAAMAEAEPAEAPMLVKMMPAKAPLKLRQKAFVDFQHDVKVSDIQLAAQEGYESVEHAKRYTTLGMATDQGKTSNINGLAVLSDSLGESIPDVGTTTFRPPYVPVTMGAIAGEARGSRFMAIRRTPLQDWHEGNGAVFEPVGLWRRPLAYPRQGESHEQAVNREVLAVRQQAGILDASTLGKIMVSGPDAGRFLDMLYTNLMSSLAVGKCRYGLICNENGFLIDDGVVARISEDQFLCHTTSGGADRIHAMMEDWLQTEWHGWKVWVTNLTEQFAQIAVVGPRARDLLTKVGGMDFRKSEFPFMTFADGALAGIPVRIFRISFSGELSYEIAVRASRGRELWDKIFDVARGMSIKEDGAFQLTAYGTDALHVLRAEKGYIMIGDETDGTVTPLDLNLGWAVSKKKADFLGKRGMMRPHLSAADRWKLVGLETVDGSVIPEGAYVVLPGKNANGQRLTEGRVTSTYFSPTLGRGIAMALVANGPERMGAEVNVATGRNAVVKAKIVSNQFHDPEGADLDP
jgi:sarcosine oxidase, subunit alpha